MGACPQVVAYSSPLLLGKVVLFDYRTATATNSVCIPQQSATHWLGILPCLVAKHTCCLWGAGSLGRSTALGELPSWCGSNTTNHGTSAAYHLHSHHAVQPGNLLTFSERKGNAAYEESSSCQASARAGWGALELTGHARANVVTLWQFGQGPINLRVKGTYEAEGSPENLSFWCASQSQGREACALPELLGYMDAMRSL
eukprot:1158804-Pelagomonas_calceolata.AAC.6